MSEKLTIECSDGRTREVEVDPISKIVSRSRVISEGKMAGVAIESMGLTDRQKRGLEVPQRARPEEFMEPLEEDPTSF